MFSSKNVKSCSCLYCICYKFVFKNKTHTRTNSRKLNVANGHVKNSVQHINQITRPIVTQKAKQVSNLVPKYVSAHKHNVIIEFMKLKL